MKKLGICVAIGTAMWFAPAPAGVTAQVTVGCGTVSKLLVAGCQVA
jgi:hypothetical protein